MYKDIFISTANTAALSMQQLISIANSSRSETISRDVVDNAIKYLERALSDLREDRQP